MDLGPTHPSEDRAPYDFAVDVKWSRAGSVMVATTSTFVLARQEQRAQMEKSTVFVVDDDIMH
jgi:hypothetical protein